MNNLILSSITTIIVTHKVDPYRNSRFTISIDSVKVAGFSEVAIPDSSIDPIEYRNGDDATVRKIPGLVKCSNIILKSGISDSMEIYDWFKDTLNGNVESIKKISPYL